MSCTKTRMSLRMDINSSGICVSNKSPNPGQLSYEQEVKKKQHIFCNLHMKIKRKQKH